jgi:hypothetical protein
VSCKACKFHAMAASHLANKLAAGSLCPFSAARSFFLK